MWNIDNLAAYLFSLLWVTRKATDTKSPSKINQIWVGTGVNVVAPKHFQRVYHWTGENIITNQNFSLFVREFFGVGKKPQIWIIFINTPPPQKKKKVHICDDTVYLLPWCEVSKKVLWSEPMANINFFKRLLKLTCQSNAYLDHHHSRSSHNQCWTKNFVVLLYLG